MATDPTMPGTLDESTGPVITNSVALPSPTTAPHLDEIAQALDAVAGFVSDVSPSEEHFVWNELERLSTALPDLLRLAREGERLEERVRVLEGALRPFAEAWRDAGDDLDSWPVDFVASAAFKAAAQALAATGEE